jgi:hypothetical protein
MRYLIISRSTEESLIRAMTEKMIQGYVPTGGVFVEKRGDLGNRMFYQAIVKENK